MYFSFVPYRTKLLGLIFWKWVISGMKNAHCTMVWFTKKLIKSKVIDSFSISCHFKNSVVNFENGSLEPVFRVRVVEVSLIFQLSFFYSVEKMRDDGHISLCFFFLPAPILYLCHHTLLLESVFPRVFFRRPFHSLRTTVHWWSLRLI